MQLPLLNIADDLPCPSLDEVIKSDFQGLFQVWYCFFAIGMDLVTDRIKYLLIRLVKQVNLCIQFFIFKCRNHSVVMSRNRGDSLPIKILIRNPFQYKI
jgi:hypothetical protein